MASRRRRTSSTPDARPRSLSSSGSKSGRKSSSSGAAGNLPPPPDKDEVPNASLLNSVWTFWFDDPSAVKARRSLRQADSYEDQLKELGSVRSVEMFWRYLSHLLPPANMGIGSNYHFFRHGIRPMWEDRANVDGGKWVITIDSPLLTERVNDLWLATLAGLIGEQIDLTNQVTGAVISRRRERYALALWTADKSSDKLNLGVGKRWLQLLPKFDYKIAFKHHTDAKRVGKSYSTTAHLEKADLTKAINDPTIPGVAGLAAAASPPAAAPAPQHP
eukprot:m.118066 g.118066  ORF g.118066 m.118066 type:complete len:275 (+) comp9528_c0_seq1:899-1723(+)